MPNFVIAFRAPAGRALTAAEEARWPVWFDKISSQIVDPGNRVGEVRSLPVTAARALVLAGYIVVAAGNIDAAVAVAEQCPMLLQGGAVEVAAVVSADGMST
jgi:ribulose kinase